MSLNPLGKAVFRTAPILVPCLLACAGVVLVVLWVRGGPPAGLAQRLPVAEAAVPAAQAPTEIVGTFAKADGTPADLPGAWPGFRGPKLDAISTEQVPLAREWPEGGPKVLWSVELGEGYAGAAVLNGRVYVLDYDHAGQADVLRCMSLADGRDIWRYSYPVEVKRNHGMSRTVPAVTERYVVSLGPKCHVTCLDSTNGELKWAIDLVRTYGTKVPPWYAGQCPLIDGDRAIIAPGGRALMIAVDLETGKVVWRTPNLNAWQMTHCSIMPMDFAGRRMYVYCASGGVAGIDAANGAILWQTTDWRINIAAIPTPVILGDGRIFLAGGYNSGCMLLELKQQDGKIVPSTVFRLKPNVFGSDQQTPIFYEGHIYGVIPGGQLACLTLDGKQVWTSGSQHRFGLGPYMIAGGMIYVMNDTGLLSLVEASPAGFKLLAEAQVLHGHDSWGPMALAGGKLILRDLTNMVCLDVRGN
ncbi:MAG TPA: PQQ-binding-like beta-propeller repeat protein [Phycisphaerae bacterium]|nr:PQQ-binding-like beta-propeller repeat protein [Phycisphaerae bacterium]